MGKKVPAREVAQPEDPLLTIKDVASLAGCSVQKVYQLVNERRIPGVIRIDSMIRIPRSSAVGWIEQHRDRGAA